MVVFGRIERAQRRDLRHDRTRECLRLRQLRNVRLRFALLLVARIKDRRAILRPMVRTLAIQLRGIVRDREKDLHQLPVRDLRRIEHDLHGLRVARVAGADLLV